MKTSLLITSLLWVSAPALADVRVDGDVAVPQQRAYTPGMSLHDLLEPAMVSLSAYSYGAYWLHVPAREVQYRLKLGVLFDLEQVREAAQAEEKMPLAAKAAELHAWVQTLPITGRRVAKLEPLVPELQAQYNYEIADGDRVFYPPRPTVVEVVGAVTNTCLLDFQALRSTQTYVAECAAQLPLADPNWLYLLQPDGSVHKLGASAWNRADESALPAPGARIYVPLRTLGDTPDLNDELAALIATQPLAQDHHE